MASSARIHAVRLTHDETLQLVHEADVSPIIAAIGDDVDLVVLNHLLEACPRAADVVSELAAHLPIRALLVVVYSNNASAPGRLLRRHWRRFFHWKAVYFNSENLRGMLQRADLRLRRAGGLEHFVHGEPCARPRPSGHSGRHPRAPSGLGCGDLRAPTGTYVSIFEGGEEVEGRRPIVRHRARVQRGGLRARRARRTAG